MATAVHVTWADITVHLSTSGPYSPDIADDLTNRARALLHDTAQIARDYALAVDKAE